jgi:CheY-like chemotaxis protein
MSPILIVDDDPVIRAFVDEALRDEGYATVVAGDGETGVALARALKPSVILMDLMMPRLDGVAAIELLKRDPTTSWMRIVAMSAGRKLREQVARLAADGLLAKPFELDSLFAEVARQLCLAVRPEYA